MIMNVQVNIPQRGKLADLFLGVLDDHDDGGLFEKETVIKPIFKFKSKEE